MAKAMQKPAYLLGLKPGNFRRVDDSVKLAEFFVRKSQENLRSPSTHFIKKFLAININSQVK
jgi:hypothetical protein